MSAHPVTYPAKGIELHWKQCPLEERHERFLVCAASHPGCWYVQRGARTVQGAGAILGKLRRSYGYVRPRENFRIWDQNGPWPDA